MAVDKDSLLQAVAAAGEQGRKDYEASRAQMEAQQAEAIKMALGNAIASAAPQGAQAEIARIIAQPYQAASLRSTEHQAASTDWFNRSQWNQGIFQHNIEGLREALIAQTLAEAAAGGGGGSGGGGGGKGDEPMDWYDNLKDMFGTAAIGKNAIAAEAKAAGLTSYDESGGLSPYEATAKYAAEKYGVPAGVGASWYTQSKDDAAFEEDAFAALRKAEKKGMPLQKFMRTARRQAQSQPGPQKYITKKLKAQASQTLKKKRKRR